MAPRMCFCSQTLSDQVSAFLYCADPVRWVYRNLLWSRKRKLAQLFEITTFATVETSKLDNQEFRDNAQAFQDANDLERSVSIPDLVLIANFQLLHLCDRIVAHCA